jgi:hypothetical protein
MTGDEFRSLALSLPEAVEAAHMGHPDFRVRGKIFATLSGSGECRGMVKLPPDQQMLFVQGEPGVFEPAKGAWGRQGSTMIDLPTASWETVRQAVIAAWRNVAPKGVAQQLEE